MITSMSDTSNRRLWRALRAVAAAMAIASAIAAPVSAQPFVTDIRIGGLVHDMPQLWSGFQLEPRSVDINIEVQLRALTKVFGGELKPAFGGTISPNATTSKGYADLRWEAASAAGIFIGFGIGAAIHDGKLDPTQNDRKALGSRVLFHIPFELGWRWDRHNSISIYFEHVSNANIARYNEGMDGLGIRYGYRF